MTRTHLHHAHSEHRSVAGGQARATVFGVSDGLVSNISLILGFAGSGVDASVVRLAGLAGLLAGSISMAAGEWVSVTAQNELIRRELDVERRELARNPEAETAELTQIYESRGVAREPAREVAEAVMRVPETALKVHAQEELGISPDSLGNAWTVGLLSFFASPSARSCRSSPGSSARAATPSSDRSPSAWWRRPSWVA